MRSQGAKIFSLEIFFLLFPPFKRLTFSSLMFLLSFLYVSIICYLLRPFTCLLLSFLGCKTLTMTEKVSTCRRFFLNCSPLPPPAQQQISIIHSSHQIRSRKVAFTFRKEMHSEQVRINLFNKFGKVVILTQKKSLSNGSS